MTTLVLALAFLLVVAWFAAGIRGIEAAEAAHGEDPDSWIEPPREMF